MTALLATVLLAASALGGSNGSSPPRPETAAASAETPAPLAQAALLPPPTGSHLPPDKNNCIACHGESDLWEGQQRRLFIPREQLDQDVHWRKGVNCHDCHGGNYETQEVNKAHAAEDGFRAAPNEVRRYCAVCHKDQALELVKGVHDKAGEKNERGQGTPLRCDQCHAAAAHHLLPVRDARSPVFADHQVETCGSCHAENLKTYVQSVHGQGLYKLGLLVTAACADCHGAHGIYRAPDKRSTLYPINVARTCGKCHRFIEERLQKSVHGHGNGAGALAARVAPGGKGKQTPTCTSCHQGHDLADPESAVFRAQLPNRCGNCHSSLGQYYTMSVHGELTELGYGPAAKCSDCHGDHEILAVSDPASRLSAANRIETCQKCHPYATVKFAAFDPHADYTSRQRDPVLYWVYKVLMTLLIGTFCAFGIHCLLWFIRGLISAFRSGRPRRLVPGGKAYVRFVPFHRVAHTCLLSAFLGLALTGLPLKYCEHGWAKNLAFCLGGFESTSVWHRVFAILTFGCLMAYLVRLLRLFLAGRRTGAPAMHLLFGPDSPLPNLRDLKDLGRMLLWFVGAGRKPTFERWTYWEKFDFWGAVTDTLIIGSTGLILWFPNLFCTFLPGSTLNIAKVIHSTQALLATGFVFAIHFFSTHFRAEKFPADLSVLIGLVSEEEMKEERPEFLQRMRREGKLEQLQTTVPSRRQIWLRMTAGLLVLAGGLSLLALMIVAGFQG